MDRLPKTRAEAKRIGAVLYIGPTCPKGHDSPRYVRGAVCVQCVRERNAGKFIELEKIGSRRGKMTLARHAAMAAGETTYREFSPCKHGHFLRFTASTNCAECSKIALAKSNKKTSCQRRQKLYGLSNEAVQAMIAEQKDACGICGDPISLAKCHVDHCHATKKVRGILCGRCNQALGLFRDNPETIRRAALYVER
jgi:hypothetical protein